MLILIMCPVQILNLSLMMPPAISHSYSILLFHITSSISVKIHTEDLLLFGILMFLEHLIQ